MLTGKHFFAAKMTALLVTTFLFTGCANTEPRQAVGEESALPETKSMQKSEVDPYEGFNRNMFSFNDHLDDYVAKPISDVYVWATPTFLKTGVSNFFSNLKDINVVLNDNMQGKFQQGAEDVGRFVTNSTLGFFGFIDVATDLGLSKHEEDFGQTLAVWGVPQGAYLVLPVLGPTTVRGLPAGVFDVAANPTTYIGMPVQLVSMLNTRANADGALKFIDEAAIDPYVFTREAYLQNQKHLITDGQSKTNVDILPLEDDLLSDVDAAESKNKNTVSTTAGLAGNKLPGGQIDAVNQSLENAVTALDKANTSLEETSAKVDKLKKKRRFKRR
ncbi:VacJ family lipoprotein [Methylomonas sp. AM2-LC]|uniref:MlaA family lipoprotein n=1 Tax=Methylomonas sp. AM2-LC TaxID=3153301 RepID=UPI0032662F72